MLSLRPSDRPPKVERIKPRGGTVDELPPPKARAQHPERSPSKSQDEEEEEDEGGKGRLKFVVSVQGKGALVQEFVGSEEVLNNGGKGACVVRV